MSEIVSIHLGTSGSNIGAAFFGKISQEHGLDDSGIATNADLLEKINVYYKEEGDGVYQPRSVLADYDFGTFAEGKYGSGVGASEDVLEAVRQEVEASNHLQG